MIRQAVEADLPAIRDLLVKTWHATYDAIYGVGRVDEITGEWHSLPALKSRLDRPGAIFLVAEAQGSIAAMAYATPVDAMHAKLHQLYVLPDSQGRGLGYDLLAAVEAGLSAAQTLALEVEEANAAARRFYERHGFTQVGATPNCGAQNSGIPALVYEKSLA